MVPLRLGRGTQGGMGKVMMINRSFDRNLLLLGLSLMLVVPAYGTQHSNGSAAPNADQTRRILIDKARALDARGRPDMAVQLWQQVLLSDPKNSDALAGLARDLKLNGSADQANQALERLKRVNPNDPNIGKIQQLSTNKQHYDRLRQAGDLAKSGRAEEAMRIYREQYGDNPPDGDIALAYYQTLYGTANGKAEAIAGMRRLYARNQGDSRIGIQLGTMLTYDARNRAEGIRILQQYAKDGSAQAALRQALLWNAENPSEAAQLKRYLKEHPQDAEIAGFLKSDEHKLAQMNSGIARTPEERAAFAALNARHIDDAQKRFQAILDRDPKNGRAAAGMGFVRMQQSNFGAAISYLTQAEENGYKDRSVEAALEGSRFWFTMGEASQAFDDNQFDLASEKYKVALVQRPNSPEALKGMAGLLLKQQQYPASAAVYEQLVKTTANDPAAWRGLFLAYAHDGQNERALGTQNRFPLAVKKDLATDPEYLRTLAALYTSMGREDEAEVVLTQALKLPFPDEGANLQEETRMQYAGILMEAKRYSQAIGLYTQIVDHNPDNTSAWMGLVSARHELGADADAIADVQRMPPTSYEKALRDADFLSMLGAIYQQANNLEVAQGLIEKAIVAQTMNGGKPTLTTRLQLAAIYLKRNNTAQAYQMYRKIIADYPEKTEAWKGLISSLLATNRFSEASGELHQIPPAVRKQLEADYEFAESEASIYASLEQIPQANEAMNRVLAHYRAVHMSLPPAVEVQYAWLLFNTKNDRGLYTVLMHVGGRKDLTPPQREMVEQIWANWTVRRAQAALENGDQQRAGELLDAAGQAFPDNPTVLRAVAGGYVQIGRTKDAMTIYRALPMQNASSTDYQGAVSAALAANDRTQAEAWLREALSLYPKDPDVLRLAARFEQSRGDNQRAADYWRAALAAMPQVSPTDRLAHVLAYPEQDRKAHRAATVSDLERLLDPKNEPFAKTTKLPPLPSYGRDPYNPGAPVIVPGFPGVQDPQASQWLPDGPAAPQQKVQPAPKKPTIAAPAANVKPLGEAPSATSPVRPELSFEDLPVNIQTAPAPTMQQAANQQQTTIQPLALATTSPVRPALSGELHLSNAQYTPSTQDATTGAFSAPVQQQPVQPVQPAPLTKAAIVPVDDKPAAHVHHKAKARAKAPVAQATNGATLGSAPAVAQQTAPEAESYNPLPQQSSSSSTTGLSDQELQDRDLPPLRGPWVRVQRRERTLSPRDQVEAQLTSLESSYSGWIGGSGLLNYRSGDAGYSQLTTLEAPMEASAPLGYAGRIVFVAKPVFLDSGQADGSSVITVQENPTTTSTSLVSISQPIGTLPSSDTTIPTQQNAAGIGGEVQLIFPTFALAGGTTPYGFLVQTFTGRMMWRPANGGITISGSRDSVKDSQLSYAGLRDPAGNTQANQGNIWGGVIANQAELQYAHGTAQSGFYLTAGGQYITGYKVLDNRRYHGGAGAFWRALTVPESGNLTVGVNFFAMHYQHNEGAYTYGLGGYFSPQAYLLGNVPITWEGHQDTRWHYSLMGSFGVQGFNQQAANLWPFVSQAALEAQLHEAKLPARTSVGANYDFKAQVAYQISPHWFAGGYVGGNNSRDYNSANVGFYIRYLFRSQPSTVTGPTGIFPTDGIRPFQVP